MKPRGTLIRSVLGLSAFVALALLAAMPAQATMAFNLTATGNSNADAGFAAAGSRWSALYNDAITVNITTGFASLGGSILAQNSSVDGTYTYTNVRSALVGDQTTAHDATAVSHLQAAPALRLYINYTANNPNGSGSATPYVDSNGNANNTTIRLSNANAKALGLRAGNNGSNDATITFNSDFTWDFNPADGITAGSYDFVGIATHEIGHALGFVSGVDVLDTNSPGTGGPFNDSAFTYVSALDLYRYSSDSVANTSLDWTAGTAAKYFSIDGGATDIAAFATGTTHGDGRQASHWKDNLGLGVMDPTAAAGELLSITSNDITAFDVIGYNYAPVPEPVTLTLFGMGGVVMFFRSRRRG